MEAVSAKQHRNAPPMPPGPVDGPSAWRGEELARSEDWIYRLSDADVAEIDAALGRHQNRPAGRYSRPVYNAERTT